MIFNKPEVEFVVIDTTSSIATVSGTQGGDRCTGTEIPCDDIARQYITCTNPGDINGYLPWPQ